MSEKGLVTTDNNEPVSLSVNAQATLDFTLIGTQLKMGFTRIDGVNTFIIIPAPNQNSSGMSIGEMIKGFDNLLKGYDPSLSSNITEEQITGPIKDVNEAAQTKGESGIVQNFDYENITIYLRQAFLMISTGKAVEFALEIDVGLNGLFPSNQSFLDVKLLTLSIWNTKRKNILDMMNIIDVSKLIEEAK